MSAVEIADTRVEYFVDGSGPPLVLVHGSTMDATSNFEHLVGALSDARTVVRPNLAGSGATPLPDDGVIDVPGLVAQVVAVIGAVSEGPVDLVGFSLGAVVSAALAASRPDLVRRLVLVAPWADSSEPRVKLSFEALAAALEAGPQVSSRYGPLVAFSPRFLAGLGRDGLAALLSGTPAPGTAAQVDLNRRIDVTDDLRRISAPTLVIGNSLDYLVPVERALEVHRLIPGSRYAELASGHVVTAERPDEFVAVLRGFLLPDK